MEVEEAVREIGGILTALSQEARFAVLKKVSGAFGFKPKAAPGKGPRDGGEKKGKTKSPPKEVAKSDFNESFSHSAAGQILSYTSKVMKETSKSTTEKVGPELYELHRFMLTERSKAKASGIIPKAEALPDSLPAEATALRLIKSYSAIKSAFHEVDKPLPASGTVFQAGWCLLQGKVPQDLSPEAGIIPNEETWNDVSPTVPRTDEEAKTRSSALVDLRKARRERKKEQESDDQTPASKRSKLDDDSSKTPPKEEDTGKDEQAMALDEQESG
jgi:hypothetical protein